MEEEEVPLEHVFWAKDYHRMHPESHGMTNQETLLMRRRQTDDREGSAAGKKRKQVSAFQQGQAKDQQARAHDAS